MPEASCQCLLFRHGDLMLDATGVYANMLKLSHESMQSADSNNRRAAPGIFCPRVALKLSDR